MMKKTILFSIIVGVGLGFVRNAWAQEIQNSAKPDMKWKPIVCKWTTLHGMEYFLDKQKIQGNKLKDLILDTRDAEASRLINLSDDSKTVGWIGIGAGTGVMIGGLIGAAHDPNTNSVNGAWVAMVVVGGVIDLAGALFIEQSHTAEFGAVQRYNQLAYGGADLSLRSHALGNNTLISWNVRF